MGINQPIATRTIDSEENIRNILFSTFIDDTDTIFNPKEYTFTERIPWRHHSIQELDSPELEFNSDSDNSFQHIVTGVKKLLQNKRER